MKNYLDAVLISVCIGFAANALGHSPKGNVVASKKVYQYGCPAGI